MATATKRSSAKRPSKKATAKRSMAKRATAKKATAKKATAKKATAKKATAKRSTAKRATAKKGATKRAGATKTSARKAPARKASAKKAGARKSTATKAAAKKSTAKRSAARKGGASKRASKSASKSAAGRYTKPELRERIKARVTRGSKGGKPGQWSARKAQLVAHEYEEAGGGYRGGKSGTQRHLDQWTKEEWTTSDGKRARRSGGTTRYLPKKAWDKLSASEKRATNRKKVEGSREGRQHVANTGRAKRARKTASSR